MLSYGEQRGCRCQNASEPAHFPEHCLASMGLIWIVLVMTLFLTSSRVFSSSTNMGGRSKMYTAKSIGLCYHGNGFQCINRVIIGAGNACETDKAGALL